MKKRQRVKIKRELLNFSNNYITTINKILNSFEQIQEEIRKSIPNVFNSNKHNIDTFYSENRNHLMILFEESNNNNRTFTLVKDNIFDILDSTGTWNKMKNCAFCFENSSGIIDSCSVQGLKPFEVYGDSKIILSNFKYTLPSGVQKEIPFGFIFSLNHFVDIKSDLNKFIQNQIYSYWDYYRKFDKKKLDSSYDQKKYKENVKNILNYMNEIFFNSDTDEKTIDDFITDNPIILERCLDINPDSLMSQAILINEVKESFNQDMKPDLICKNIYDEWIILDYKRAKRIVKKEATARQDVTSEVHDLKTQLKNYREYFNDSSHRKLFLDKTGHEISSKPQAIGLIGVLQEEEQKIFKDAIEDYPNWLKIETYDRIYKKFEYYYNALF